MRVLVIVDQRGQNVVGGHGGVDDACTVQLDGVLAATRCDAYLGRVLFRQHLEMVGQLGVEHLLSGRDVKRIESGSANKGLGDDPGPGVSESEETNPGFSADGFADDLVAVLELGENGTVEVEVEVKDVWLELAIGSGGDRSVDQATNWNRELAGDPEEQRELVIGVDAGHRNNDLFGISTRRIPHRFQMRMGKISRPQIAGEGATERSGSEILPEPAVKTSWIETRVAFRVETDRELSTVDQGEAGTRPRQLSPRAHELEPCVDKLERNRLHGNQLAAPRWE